MTTQLMYEHRTHNPKLHPGNLAKMMLQRHPVLLLIDATKMISQRRPVLQFRNLVEPVSGRLKSRPPLGLDP